MTDGATAPKISGCSKRPDFSPAQPWRSFHPPALSLPRQTLYPETHPVPSKAVASEEARRYGPHFVGPFALVIDRGERKSPSRNSDIREPLSEARTVLADVFSILLKPPHEHGMHTGRNNLLTFAYV